MNKNVDKHPLAGQQMDGSKMIIQVLADEGVDTIFGYSGGAILPTYDAIFQYNAAHEKDKQINLIVPANEQGAGFMAAGYARSSGRVGVFLVTSGPGATNCVTPIRDCMADSVPVVLICGQVTRAAMGTDAFQEAPVSNVMSPCAKHVMLVTKPDELEASVRTAFKIASKGRPGPVVLDIPKDVQNTIGTFRGEGYLNFRGFNQRVDTLMKQTISTNQIKLFYEMLSESDRPLIYAGGGVVNSNAGNELREFAEVFQIPVVTTLMGIGAISTTSPLSMHMLGMHGAAYANYAVEDCDFLIAAGARFDDRVAGKVDEFAPNAKNIAHLDIDASEIGKVKSVTWSFVGDAKIGLRQLIDYGQKFKKNFSSWNKHLQRLKKAHAFNYDKDTQSIQPQYVLECLNKSTNGNAIIATGVGQHQMWAAQYCEFVKPRSWLTSGSMGTMGFGLPAAIGAQVANPGKLVIDIDGDGSIRMNLGELETATTYNLPVKILLMNNLGDGMVRQWQRGMFGNRFSGSDKSLHKKDFVKAAEADGYKFAKSVSEKDKVADLIEEFIAFEGPAFLEVLIDRDAEVWPMVGPGKGYKDMMTGNYIRSRNVEEVAAGENKETVSDSF